MYRRVVAADAFCVARVSDGVLVRVISAHAIKESGWFRGRSHEWQEI